MVFKASANGIKIVATQSRAFTATSGAFKGIMPETDSPATKEVEPEARVTAPTELSNEEYNEAADTYINQLVATLEELQEARGDVDVEYSVSPCGKASPFQTSQRN